MRDGYITPAFTRVPNKGGVFAYRVRCALLSRCVSHAFPPLETAHTKRQSGVPNSGRLEGRGYVSTSDFVPFCWGPLLILSPLEEHLTRCARSDLRKWGTQLSFVVYLACDLGLRQYKGHYDQCGPSRGLFGGLFGGEARFRASWGSVS